MKRLSLLAASLALILTLSACMVNVPAETKEETHKNALPQTAKAVQDVVFDKLPEEKPTPEQKPETKPEKKTEPAVEQKPETPVKEPAKPEVKQLDRDAALAAALKDAGLTKAEVRDIDVEFDIERGIMVWEVDFEKGKTEYSYEINAETGAVIEREVERD